MSNPYLLDNIRDEDFLTEQDCRGQKANEILGSNENSGAMPNVSIVAPPRFGKTCFLRFLERRLRSRRNVYTTFINIQGLGTISQEGFYEALATSLSVEQSIIPRGSSLDFNVLRQHLIDLKNMNRRLVILIDGIHAMANAVENRFFDNLRSLAEDQGLILIVSSRVSLSELFDSKASPFFSSLLKKELSYLTDTEVSYQLAKGDGVKEWNKIGEVIRDLTGHHPWFFRMACYRAWEKFANSSAHRDLDALKQQVMDDLADQYQKIYTRCARSDVERTTLQALIDGCGPIDSNGLIELKKHGYVVSDGGMPSLHLGSGFANYVSRRLMDQPGEFASQDLVKALYQYELTETFAGRTMLLDGLPAEIELKREPDNRKIDLMIIIGRLRQLERLPTGEWPITKLINNAIKYGPSAPVKETLVEILKCIG